MKDDRFFERICRKTIVTGHYGSGKTEFSVSLALILAENDIYNRHALIDLDIANPYFRSREQREFLKSAGIEIFGSAFETESTAELPALGAKLRAPLENNAYRVIVDTGGNDTGALVLNQFSKYFKSDKADENDNKNDYETNNKTDSESDKTDDDTTIIAVVNANRPDTGDIDSALFHIRSIEQITGLTVTDIVSNTHLLRETTADDIIEGYEFCKKICAATGKRLLCSCYPKELVDPSKLTAITETILPLGLYMRPTWLDR